MVGELVGVGWCCLVSWWVGFAAKGFVFKKSCFLTGWFGGRSGLFGIAKAGCGRNALAVTWCVVSNILVSESVIFAPFALFETEKHPN